MLKNSLVVYPTSRAIREEVSKKRSFNQLLEKYISIGDFFQRVVLDKDNRKFIDKNLKILYLKDAIKNSSLEKLGLSSDFSTFIKQSEYLFRFFIETSNEYVEFDTLLSFDTYTLYSDHISILKTIHKNYTKLLQDNNYVDNILLPNRYIINSEYIEQFTDITINLEGYLSSFEFKVISDISKQINTKIVFTLNEFNQKNMKLFNVDDNLDLDTTYTIDISNNKIVDSKALNKENQTIVISPVSSQIEQIAFIKYQIAKMIKNGIEPEKIAVAIPNETIATTLEMFDSEHYFNFAMGRGIQKSRVVQTLKHINKILVDYEPKDDELSKFLELDFDIFNCLFKNHWNNILTKDLFDEIFKYLLSLESNEEIKEFLEQTKISLDILIFSNIGDVCDQILLKEFIKLLQKQISSITIDDINGGKITVLGILETRLVEFDGVIVIDFNDDKIPKISVKDKFISSKLKELSGLPTLNDRENLQRYYYKRFFSKAKSIAISYIDDDVLVMSRFIMQLFPNYKMYLEKKDYSSILFNTKTLNHFYKDIELDIDLSKKEWSATSLKSYLTCKRQYYFNYISKIKEHTISIKPQNYEVGNIIHNALENAVKENNLNEQYISNYLAKEATSNPYLILELELWKKRLNRFLEYEKIRASNGITIDSVELPFNLKYNDITIKGKIDRIDKYPDNTYEILDYKTSSSLKIDTIKNYKESKDFQLEFYYLASRDKMINDVAYYTLNDTTIKNEVMLKEKIELLNIHFKALKTTKVNFKQTDNQADCLFCSYKTICKR
ncbi:MAG: PD-(D/E)XK nuclease family protein [Campylobacterota bacterium]|nr:PD-(D/E)XK nuclease family protein [Campylobacterota bacterium]